MGGGAWPFLVGGVICLVNSDNERDSSLLNRLAVYTAVLRLSQPAGGSIFGWLRLFKALLLSACRIG